MLLIHKWSKIFIVLHLLVHEPGKISQISKDGYYVKFFTKSFFSFSVQSPKFIFHFSFWALTKAELLHDKQMQFLAATNWNYFIFNLCCLLLNSFDIGALRLWQNTFHLVLVAVSSSYVDKFWELNFTVSIFISIFDDFINISLFELFSKLLEDISQLLLCDFTIVILIKCFEVIDQLTLQLSRHLVL